MAGRRIPKKRSSTDVDYPPAKIPKLLGIYLKGYTPVRTIEVTNIPDADNATTEYLRGYFEGTTGHVDNVSIIRDTTNGREQMLGYVTFTMPEDAARLIRDADLISNIKFTVKIAKNQPKFNPNALKLEQINDDCLLHIISYLDLVDVVNLGKTCARMKSVTERTYKKYKRFSFGANTRDSSINESTLPTILEVIGKQIRMLQVYGLEPNILEAFTEQCPKIRAMQIINPSNLSAHSFKMNKDLFNNLQILTIKGGGLYDASMREICSTSKLQFLKLDNCRNLKGKFLSELRKLKVLRVFGREPISYANDVIFQCQKNNCLEVFESDFCSYVNFFQDLKRFENIECLGLNFSKFEGNMAELVALKNLTRLNSFTAFRKSIRPFPNLDSFLSILSEIDTLKSLAIEGVEIDDETWRHLSKIKNLNRLRLSISELVGHTFYETFYHHLPNLKLLTVQEEYYQTIDKESISRMVALHQNLEHFTFYWKSPFSTIKFLQILLRDLQQARRKAAIEVGFRGSLNDDQMIQFQAVSEGFIVLAKQI